MTDLSIRLFIVMTSMLTSIHDGLHRREEGQDLLEYALLGGLIAAGIVAVLVLFGTQITNMITNIGRCIDFSSGTPCTPGF